MYLINKQSFSIRGLFLIFIFLLIFTEGRSYVVSNVIDSSKVINSHFTYTAVTDSEGEKKYYITMPISYGFGASLNVDDSIKADKCILNFKFLNNKFISITDTSFITKVNRYIKSINYTSRSTGGYGSRHDAGGNFRYSGAPLTSMMSSNSYNMRSISFTFTGELSKRDIEFMASNSVRELSCNIYFTKAKVKIGNGKQNTQLKNLIDMGFIKSEEDIPKYIRSKEKFDSLKNRSSPVISDTLVNNALDYWRIKQG